MFTTRKDIHPDFDNDYLSGMHFTNLMEKYSISESLVRLTARRRELDYSLRQSNQRGKPHLTNNDEFRRLWNDGTMSFPDIGLHYGVSGVTIRSKGTAFGYGSRKRAVIIPNAESFYLMWASDMPRAKIAVYYGVRIETINDTAKRYGYDRGATPNSSVAAIVPKKRTRMKAMKSGVYRKYAEVAPKSFVDGIVERLGEARVAAVAATCGKYQNISALAADWGITQSQMQAYWHRVAAL